MDLNNFLAANGGTDRLSWRQRSEGPAEQVTWFATAMSKLTPLRTERLIILNHTTVDGIATGHGQGATLSQAKDGAARQALHALKGST